MLAEKQRSTPDFTGNGTVIHTEKLTKRFGDVTAVDQITMEIPRGSIFGFIGPSGCGKTTTMRLLLGIYEPTEGSATVLGHSPQTFSRQERENIGYMPQLFVLYQDLTVAENLNFAASLYGVKPKQRRARLQELLHLVELESHEKKRTAYISGGMRRRLSLAAALVHDPELIFLDEPTAGIDPVLRRKFWDHFEQLQKAGHTLFITTQYVGEAAYCDYVGVMANGRLLMVETPEDLRHRAMGGDLIRLRLVRPLTPQQLEKVKSHPLAQEEVNFLDHLTLQMVVADASLAIPKLINWCEQEGIEVESVHEHVPPFDDIFVKLVEEETAGVG